MRKFTRWIAAKLIKNRQNINDLKVRARYGALEGWTSIVINILLFVIKLLIGLYIKSVSLIADTVSNDGDKRPLQSRDYGAFREYGFYGLQEEVYREKKRAIIPSENSGKRQNKIQNSADEGFVLSTRHSHMSGSYIKGRWSRRDSDLHNKKERSHKQ
ncbi:MAG: hypothetical protein DRG87_07040 [Deltaproteobacteria bacterium]|nr:MAG: hypothetical protein DRG87_07040 [Deltaproteobacteria bacterium]